MTRSPGVSVVLPTFQRRELVRRALASAFSQTFEDFELVVVDDGSTDGTREALADLGDRIRYVWQENAGPAAARNAGIELARGEIVAFLDSDDRWLPDHLAVVTHMLARHPEAVLASTCPGFEIRGSQTPDEAEVVDRRVYVSAGGTLGGFLPCAAVRREALLEAGRFDPRIHAGEDTDLWVRLAALGPIVTLRRRTVECQTSSDSARERARRAGHYLVGTALAAGNLLELADRLPESTRGRVLRQARAGVHLAAAMAALDRGDLGAAESELREGDLFGLLARRPLTVEHRIRHHLTRAHEREVRLWTMRSLAEMWPDPGADTPRYLRVLSIGSALRLRRPGEALRLLRDWPLQGTFGFARRAVPSLRHRAHRRLLDRRSRTPATPLLPAGPPMVSVVIPTFERREPVRRAVASVLGQTYRDFEVVVVDDGSTDGTREALADLGDRIRYVWQENAGAAAARNAGVELARGRIVAFLDSDDRWLPDHLAAVVGALESDPGAVLAHTAPASRANSQGGLRAKDPLPRLLIGNAVGCLSAVAARRDAVLAVGGFDTRLRFTEDNDLWLRLSARGGRFVTLGRPTVISSTSEGSLVATRAYGEYLDELELSAAAVVAELERRGDESALGWARGRAHLLAALRARDGGAVTAEFGKACELLPGLAEMPESVATHVELALAGPDGRGRLVAAARLWPEPVAGALRERAAEADGRLRPPPQLGEAVARAAHTVMLRTGDGPLRRLWRLAHEAVARGVAAYLRNDDPALSAYVRGSLGTGEPVFGLSDIDIVIVTEGGGKAEVERRWRRLKGLAPTLCERLVETPHVYGEAELGRLARITPLTHGVRWRMKPTNREQLSEGAGAERSRLYGLTHDWRLIAGPERRPPEEPQGPDARRIAAWLELQFWWLQAFRACIEPAAPWAAYLCAKLLTEPARIWLWLDRGEMVGSRRALIERARAELPEEEDALLLAQTLLDTLSKAPPAPVEEALLGLTRMSRRIATRFDGVPGTDVKLAGGTDELVASPAAVAAAGPGDPLPLVDWRARVWSLPPDECLVPREIDSPDPTAVGRLALACNNGAYAGLRMGELLVLPSLKRARMRAVQCPATDPVSFALLAGAESASFPEVPGWSARDCAHRAMAEHLGWLHGKGRHADGPEALGRLLSAARATLFWQSIEAGEPELTLTIAAVAERLGSDVAQEALQSYRDGHAPRGLAKALRGEVTTVPAYG